MEGRDARTRKYTRINHHTLTRDQATRLMSRFRPVENIETGHGDRSGFKQSDIGVWLF